MYISRQSMNRMVTAIAVFQLAFVAVQIFIFYPCMVLAPDRYLSTKEDTSRLKYINQNQNQRGSNEFLSTLGVGSPNVANAIETEEYAPTWESLEKRPIPNWYEDAKIGIFIHWGVYSVPSFVEHGTNPSRHLYAEWFWYYWKSMSRNDPAGPAQSVRDYMKKRHPDNFHYTDYAPLFTAELFDPNAWAEIFNASGAKYIVLTSKHHDGFTLWGSKRSWNWNAVDNGPHRDLIGDLAASLRKSTDIRFGVYHSLYEWFHPLYLEDKANNFTTQSYVNEKLMPELQDLVKSYKPDVVWGDGQWEAHSDYWMSKEFLAWLYNHSPVKESVVVNDRWGKETGCKHGGFLSCSDKYNPGKLQARKWENCMTIERESYGYRRNARIHDYYDMDEITQIIAQTVSFGGNVLMNIGPTGDGRIPPVFEERLRQLGQWLRVNGEAIYGSRVCHTQKDPTTPHVYYTCTKQSTGSRTVYAILTVWPNEDHLVLSTLTPSTDTQVTWLGYHGSISWQKQSTGISIELPKISLSQIPCQWAWVFKFERVTE